MSSRGEQVGVVSFSEAIRMAEDESLDLVEVAPNVFPPVCKVMDYGKFRYDQTKKEKESKKAQHQVKIKEVKLKPHIDEHDLNTKLKKAKDFLQKGCKVKFTCTFRGRELAHPEIGEELVRRCCDFLVDVADVEAPAKRMGRMVTVVLAPAVKKKRASSQVAKGEQEHAEEEGEES